MNDAIEALEEVLRFKLKQSVPSPSEIAELTQAIALAKLALCVGSQTNDKGQTYWSFQVEAATYEQDQARSN